MDIKQIPCLILALNGLYEHVMNKLKQEGMEPNIAYNVPKTREEPLEDDVGDELPPINKPW